MRRLLAVLVGACLLSACSIISTSDSGGGANPAIIPASWGCRGAIHHVDGSTSLPMMVGRSGLNIIETVNVCINGKGPYGFVLDTGAASSVLDSSVASALHLPWAGPSTGSSGAGCTSTERPAKVARWQVGGLALAPQSISVQSVPGFGDGLDGLLGSDVWSRFGALRLDFRASTVVLPGSEGPAPSTEQTLRGGTGPATPTPLLHDPPTLTAAMDVATGPLPSGLHYAQMLVWPRLGGHAAPFAPDTGSSSSAVDSTYASTHHLGTTAFTETSSTVCSTITTAFVLTGRWHLGGLQLPGALLSTIDLGPVNQAGFSGLMGSDLFVRYASVVFDYRGGRLLLGAG